MTSPSRLREACGPIADDAIYYLRIYTVSDLMIFMRTLETHLGVHPQVALLVLNSLSFPFQTPKLSMQARKSLLDQIKQCIAKSCATHTLSVISTMQLSTKLIGADGKPSNFDDKDARGILAPQLGPGYLPTTRSYRVRFSHSAKRAGYVLEYTQSSYKPHKGSLSQYHYTPV
ncbi:hypothetical protein ONZ45_g17976 [Pleurotus djamor]|nr:hypothetical protein ONZ45_g17976 [Pleurotus djamor]